MKLAAIVTISIMVLPLAVFSAPVVALVDQGMTSTDDAATAFTNMVTLPSPSSTDMINGNAGFQVDSRTNHAGGAMTLAAFTDGAPTVAYPGQLPADYPGVGVPAVSIGYALGSAVDIGSVLVYAYNWNGGNPPDIRGIAPFAVYTTTDATVNAGSTWTLVVDYTDISGIGPANMLVFTGDTPPADWTPYHPVGKGGAICIANNIGGAALASAVTGVRVDVYCAGFGDQLRNADNTGADVQAVSSPFLAEIDVLSVADTQAFYSSVNDWTEY